MFDKQKIIEYIEDKHLADGGYFFARIEPSGGLDTYHAVKILKMLGREPQDPQGIRGFFLEMETEARVDGINALYLIVEAFKELGFDTTRFQHYKSILEKEKNDLGGFGTNRNIYVEVDSELRTSYRTVVVSKDLAFPLDGNNLKKFIFSFQNKDCGFGSHKLSTLATTYYALAILRKLGLVKDATNTLNYLREKERKISGFYLEQLFWLVMSLHYLKQNPIDLQEIITFIQDCWRDNGGFCRSRNIGISTFEDTYYAVSVLKLLDSCNVKVFD